jgi:hypothetical protein
MQCLYESHLPYSIISALCNKEILTMALSIMRNSGKMMVLSARGDPQIKIYSFMRREIVGTPYRFCFGDSLILKLTQLVTSLWLTFHLQSGQRDKFLSFCTLSHGQTAFLGSALPNKPYDMINATETMYNGLVSQINALAPEKDTLIRTEKIVGAITDTLDQLKILIKDEGFSSEQDEIYFYKHSKPKFHALYIYHATVFSVESDKPLGSKKAIRRYFHNELRRIDHFFYHNADLYKYYRSGNTNLDKEYFTRGQGFSGFMIDIVTPIIDREFCTLHSIKLAFLIAYQQLRQYFQESMLEIENPAKTPLFGTQQEGMTWTDSKTGLIELGYALHAAGSFNNSKADIKQITDYLQTVFHVDLGNTSRTFQEILARKRGQTAFLDRLRDRLLHRIQSDE